MDFRELAYIVSIAKHQGIGRAAEEVHVSQPTLSKFVKHLEDNLGQSIFRRVGNKFLLTYAGERYVETAKTILQIKQGLDKELTDIIKDDVGELKLAFRRYGGFTILSKALIKFKELFPRIKISINEGQASMIENMILNGDIDLAFYIIQARHPNISYEIISHEEVLLIMAPDHPRAKEGISRPDCRYPWIDVSKLEHEQFILPWSDQRIRQEADRIFYNAGIKPANALTMRNVYASIQLAVDGYGLAFAGEASLRFTHTKTTPACFSVGNPYTTFDFAAAYRGGIYQPAYAKHFIAIVKALVNKNLP